MGRLTGKVALVTGAASGIGFATATRFAAEGAKVIATDIAGVQGFDLGIVHDVTDEQQWVQTIERVMAQFGHLDIAVNCAGISIERSFPSETSFEDWRRVLSINLDGVFLGTKHSLDAMQRSEYINGSIINVSSVMGMVALAGLGAYGASKGAVRMYTKSVALSCAESGAGVRVNSIHPGFIDTPMMRAGKERIADPDEARALYEGLQPMGRLGTADEVAWGAVFLASDESSFMTGTEIVIDGGYTAR